MANVWPAFPDIDISEGSLSNANQIAGDIQRLAAELHIFTEPITQSIHRVVIPSIAQNFESQGRPSWQALSEATVERRGAAGPILDESGALKSMATSFGIWTITTDEARIDDIPIEYAEFHQGGTRNMPAREFIMYQEEDIVEIERIFHEWTDDKIRTVGGF